MTETTRPKVSVQAQTANTCEVTIQTENGIARLICSNDAITVEANGNKIEVEP